MKSPRLAKGFALAVALFVHGLASAQLASPPRLVSIEPAPGGTVGYLSELEVIFESAVVGVDASDLLLGGQTATSVTESGVGQFVFGFPPAGPGVVTFAWALDHGIRAAEGDAAFVPGAPWNVTVDPALARRQVVISEFMADNDVALYDDDCDRSDWIEIHNAGPGPIDLEGWSLTDDASIPNKWRFPAYRLEGESYLIVFASQKNKTTLPLRACRTRPNSMLGFHTNFRLDPGGEYLALIAPDGEIVSAFAPAYPPQRRDVSYGRAPGSPNDVGYLGRPTPRAANVTSGEGFAPDVRFSKPSGPYVHPFLLSITTASPKAVVRYTVDGSFPAETNAQLRTYTGSIPITATMQVRARAYEPGLLPGAPASETYLRLTNDPPQLAGFTSSLPIVVMTTLRNVNVSASVNTPVHFSVFEPRNGVTTLLSPPVLATRGGAKTRGSSTGGQPQSNFAVEWWDEFNQDSDHPVLGMPEHSEWVLYAPNEFDAALIHNPFTMELSRQMNFAAPRTRFVEVYLNKGGPLRSNDWFGLYVLMEKPGLSKGRIDAPKADPEDLSMPEITGSYMFKTDRLDPGDTGFSGGSSSAFVEPKEREMKSPQRAPQLAYLTQYFRDFDNALRPTNPLLRDPVRGYRGYIEVTNWIDFHLLELLSGQVDAIRLSTYFYKRREGKIEYGPRWDYDRAWESKGDGRDDDPRKWDSGGGLFAAPWWNRVLGDRDSWQLWIDRWQMYRQSVFSQANMFSVIDAMTNEIRHVQPRENRRWTATAPRINYPNEIRIMKTWISNRLAWIDSQFAQPPRLSSGDARVAPGFLLTIAPPTSISNPTNVAVFYTLDGTDPRPARGTSAPVAFRYSEPIPISTNTRVIARTRDNGRTQRGGPPATSTWSGPAIATFVVEPLPLLVTEIQFHPNARISSNAATAPDLEFLELKNTGTREVDLVGCEFVRGIEFRFSSTSAVTRLAPGARCLLVGDAARFSTRHPDAGPVAGEFARDLANNGERLTLVGPAREVLLDFEYFASPFPAADGLGFSIVLRDENVTPIELGNPVAWRASTAQGGSPGRPDPPPGLPEPSVRVSEVMAAPLGRDDDWVELYNPEDRPADVGGWWLSDDFDDPKRARIPAGWVVPAKGYLVIPEQVFENGGATAFAFDAQGDAVWLFSADAAGELTGWFHGFTYAPSVRGLTFGRHVFGEDRERFGMTARPTRGTANAPFAVGPLIVSEVAPARSRATAVVGGQDAFLEIWNVSADAVALVDPLNPEISWEIEGSVRFRFADAFPAGWLLPAGGRVVLVGFDPFLDRGMTEVFRMRHRLDATIPLAGPWQGILPSAGFALLLLPPGAENRPATDAPYPGADVVVAVPSTPWPEAGFAAGFALNRGDASAYGNDGSSWRAARPTPGRADGDSDGLPDEWELARGLNPRSAEGSDGGDGDSDADGLPNVAEWWGDGDPRVPDGGVRIRMLETGYSRIACFFAAAPGTRWAIETSNPAGSGTWQALGVETVSPEGVLAFPLATRPGESSWFRVKSQ